MEKLILICGASAVVYVVYSVLEPMRTIGRALLTALAGV